MSECDGCAQHSDHPPLPFPPTATGESSLPLFERVGECRLGPRNVSEAGVVLARGPRDWRRKNRKLWRPTDAKNHVRTVCSPILFRH